MPHLKAKIMDNQEIGPNYFRMKIRAPEIARKALPGQFVDVRVNDTCAPLLRRPFGIHRLRSKAIEIIYEVVGEGTGALAKMKAGTPLDVIGPLGNGFRFEPKVKNREPFILVAGGMGVAPLVFLAEKLRGAPGKVILGAKAKKHILCEKEFKKMNYRVIISTDDGSEGYKGRATDLLKKELRIQRGKTSLIYACGPKSMLRAVAAISRQQGIPAQISLEEHLACGIGACLGCVVHTTQGYKRVCKEGPVFDIEQIVWE